jgi:hypothetical protein
MTPTSVVMIYTSDVQEIAVSRFSRAGEVEVSELPLPLSHARPGAEVGGVHAGLALSADQYVIVYTLNAGSGIETRAAKVSL